MDLDALWQLVLDNLSVILIALGVCAAVCIVLYALLYKRINALLVKYREIILYLIFGVLTTLVNWGIYFPLRRSINEIVANVIAWVAGVAFAYITNKLFVFESKSFKPDVLVREVISFTGARLFSLGAETAVLAVFDTWLGFNYAAVKIGASVIVIVLNYVSSKLIIFKKKKETEK